MQGSLFCQLGAVVCNWDSPWREQVVCGHYHCNWCWLLDAVIVYCINRFGPVGDLFSGMLNGKVVHSNVS